MTILLCHLSDFFGFHICDAEFNSKLNKKKFIKIGFIVFMLLSDEYFEFYAVVHE